MDVDVDRCPDLRNANDVLEIQRARPLESGSLPLWRRRLATVDTVPPHRATPRLEIYPKGV